MNKEQDKLSDQPCVIGDSLGQRCAIHGQSLADCANGRLKQVKQAREMDERSMASARAWQKKANQVLRGAEAAGPGDPVQEVRPV
jgi:hypothetical protein